MRAAGSCQESCLPMAAEGCTPPRERHRRHGRRRGIDYHVSALAPAFSPEKRPLDSRPSSRLLHAVPLAAVASAPMLYSMRKFDYPDWTRVGIVWLQIGGFASIALATAGAVLLIAAGIAGGQAIANLLWVPLWLLMIGWMVGSTLANLYPTVWLDERGLTISFFRFWRKNIPWTEVTALRQTRILLLQVLVVQANRITLWHRVIGWMYARSFSPCFLVRSNIENFEELIAEVESRLHENEGMKP